MQTPFINRFNSAYVFAALAIAGALMLTGCAAPVVIGAGAVAVAAGSTEKGLGGSVSDSGIKAKIKELHYQNDANLLTDVNVTVTQGSVVLTGKVNTPADKVEATRLTWQVKGVTEVINELIISDETSLKSAAKDKALESRLRFKLIGDGEIASLNFSSDAVNGTIYLMGVARSGAEMERVLEHARALPGVVEVVNYIRVSEDRR